jgi:hypothetical protein
VGESPARLGFLKEIMTALPYEEMEPMPEVGWSSRGVTALGKKGQCYLIYLRRDVRTRRTDIDILGQGAFKVELIDPWLMKIYPLGTISAGRQSFRPKILPCLLRITKASAEVSGASTTFEELLKKFETSPKMP